MLKETSSYGDFVIFETKLIRQTEPPVRYALENLLGFALP